MPRIKKGLIAAAGRGTRFLPFTRGCPKELIPILAKPAIQYLVEELLGAGIDQIGIVHPSHDLKIKNYFFPDAELEKYLKKNGKQKYLHSFYQFRQRIKTLKFIPQDKNLPHGTGSPVLSAQFFIGSDPFVYMYGDDIIIEDKPGRYISKLIDIYEKYEPEIIFGAQEVPWQEINRYASVKYMKDKNYPNRVEQILEKISAEKAFSNTVQFGRFVVSHKIFKVLEGQNLSRDNELWFTDAVNTLAQNNLVIAEPIKKGLWMTAGDPLRWLETNIVMGLKNKKIKEDLEKFIKNYLFNSKKN